jgi:hypothetical protein
MTHDILGAKKKNWEPRNFFGSKRKLYGSKKKMGAKKNGSKKTNLGEKKLGAKRKWEQSNRIFGDVTLAPKMSESNRWGVSAQQETRT